MVIIKNKKRASVIVLRTIAVELALLIIAGAVTSVILIGKINDKNINYTINNKVKFGLLYNEVVIDTTDDNYQLSNYLKASGYYNLTKDYEGTYRCRIKWLDYLSVIKANKGMLIDILDAVNDTENIDGEEEYTSVKSCTYSDDLKNIEIIVSDDLSISDYIGLSVIIQYDYNFQCISGNVQDKDKVINLKIVDEKTGEEKENLVYPECKKELETKINQRFNDSFEDMFQQEFNNTNTGKYSI